MFDVEGFILVGGASSRMGTDKSQLLFGGQTAVELLAKELVAVTAKVSLVGSRNENLRSGFKIVTDVYQRWGALGGIHAALSATGTEWAIVVACDLPFISRELLWHLMGLARAQPPFDAVVPIQADGRPQPLCALYRREPCLESAERLIATGEHTPRALLGAVNTRWVAFEELAGLPAADNFFFNVNTPADYEQAQQILLRNSDAAE